MYHQYSDDRNGGCSGKSMSCIQITSQDCKKEVSVFKVNTVNTNKTKVFSKCRGF